MDFATIPNDGARYYWAFRYWAEARLGSDPSCTQYWVEDGVVWKDDPVVVDNTYYGKRQGRMPAAPR